VIATLVRAGQATISDDTALATWAAIVTAYGVGALASCFSYPLFMSTAGLEFWLLNAALLQEMRLRVRLPVPLIA
jgi:hypothetical protein